MPARRILALDHDDQREAIAFLERRETYGDAVLAAERIDTHAAMIFLVGDRAYKLKRAIRFSYLDFSTLERREAVCRAELVFNKRTAPDLYLGVRSIIREADGSYAFDGAGTIIDWVVVMRRFDQGLLFDRMAERGALNDELMEQLSAEVARFHAAAEATPGHGGRASIEIEIAGNDENLALAPPDAFPRELRTALVRRWRTELDCHSALLDHRDEDGKVRRCHGDLHLRNICLWNDRPTLFDCIDVLYDLAFLLMDLLHRGLGHFANLIFNAYLDRNDETEGTAALPLMMSLRAAIRAHTGIAATHAQTHPERRREMIEEAQRYLSLASRLLHDDKPRLIAIGGVTGTGKSTLARALAPEIGASPGARLVHTDALRKRLFGVARTERLDDEAYKPEVSEQVYRLQREAAAASLRSGYSVIVDGVFARPEERVAIADIARDCATAFDGLWLTAPEDILRARVAGRTADMSDATVDVLEMQLSTDAGTINWGKVASGESLEDTAASARTALTTR